MEQLKLRIATRYNKIISDDYGLEMCAIKQIK